MEHLTLDGEEEWERVGDEGDEGDEGKEGKEGEGSAVGEGEGCV